MRVHRKLIPVLGAAAAACMLVTAAASATAAPAAPALIAPQVALTGNIAGNPRTTEPGDTDTFVFTETSQVSSGTYWFIQPFNQTGLTLGQVLCVYPQHAASSDADGWTCEPFLPGGTTTSLVLTTHITGAPGSTASVRVCAYNGNAAGYAKLCKTLSVKING
jgi:hypothetical protein